MIGRLQKSIDIGGLFQNTEMQPQQRRPGSRRVEKKELFRINEGIKVPSGRVRVVQEGQATAICTIEEALRRAADASLDLVEVAPAASPPVCRITNYQKLKFEHEKEQKRLRASQAQNKALKHVQLGAKTEQNDFEVKQSQAIRHLQKRIKIQLCMRFRRREFEALKDSGMQKMEAMIESLSPYGKPDDAKIRVEGTRMLTTISPVSKK